MVWQINEAQEKFTDLLTATSGQPQLIYDGQGLVAVVVEPEVWQEFMAWQRQRPKRTVAEALVELRQIMEEEKDFSLEIPERRDRVNGFLEEDSHHAMGYECD